VKPKIKRPRIKKARLKGRSRAIKNQSGGPGQAKGPRLECERFISCLKILPRVDENIVRRKGGKSPNTSVAFSTNTTDVREKEKDPGHREEQGKN